MPKDMGNLTQGIPTYGGWEYIMYLDTLFYDMWIVCADNMGMGLGLGLIASSLATKLFFSPAIIYS